MLRVRFVGYERELDVPAAGAEKLAQRLEAGLDDVSFPPGDLGPVLAASLCELDRELSRGRGLSIER